MAEHAREVEYPQRWEADVVLRDGASIHIRPIIPSDADALQRFHVGQSERSRYYRFFAPLERLSEREIERFTTVDFVDRVALIGLIGPDIIGVARYDRIDAESAEVAFNIADAHQGRGLGSIFLEHLVAAAREKGIRAFTAEVLPGNTQMLTVFTEAGYDIQEVFEDGVVTVKFDIDPTERALAVQEAREHRAEARSIQRLMTPGSIAVIGAESNPKRGRRLLDDIVTSGFRGRAFGVQCGDPHGFSTGDAEPVSMFETVAELPEAVDVAVVTVSAEDVPDAVTECVKLGVGSIIVQSAGFAESGATGRKRQDDLVRLVRSHGMRLLGPASYGLVNTDPEVSLNATLGPSIPGNGALGIFTQSAAIGVAALRTAERRSIGISGFVSAGSRGDVSGNDVMQFWEEDDRTAVCALYLESIGNPRKFYRIARRLSASKPVVVVKSGLTSAAPQAQSVSIAPSPRATLDAMFAQAGVLTADNLHQMFDITQVLLHQPKPAGARVGIVTNSNSLATVITEAAASWGLDVARPARAVPPDVTTDGFADALREVFEDPAVDVAVVSYIPSVDDVHPEILKAVAEISAASGKTTVACFLGMRGVTDDLWANDSAGVARAVPAYVGPEDAVLSLASAVRHALWVASEQSSPAEPENIDEEEARALVDTVLASSGDKPRELDRDELAGLLACYGIDLKRVVTVQTEDEALAAAEELGWPVVLKTTDELLRHRADLGGVILNIRSAYELGHDIEQMRNRLSAIRGGGQAEFALELQEMVANGVSCVVRSAEDPVFGPVVSFGFAGDAVELLGDSAHRVPPLTDREAGDLVRSVRAAPRLFGHRGMPLMDVEALEDVIARVSALTDDFPELRELDLNPIVVSPNGAAVLGGRAVVERAWRSDAVRRILPD